MILTERDKKLIYVLAVMLALALCTYLLVLPAYNGYTSLRNQLDTANAEYDQRQVVINNADVAQASIVELRRKLSSQSVGYQSVMHSLELDRLHTLRAVMQKWAPTRLELATMAPFEIGKFGTAVAEDEMVEQSTVGGTAWLAGSGVSMAATARQSDAVALINTIVTSPDERLETLKLTPMDIELTLDAAGNPVAQLESNNPYLTIEMTTRQFYALNQQTPELELPGTSYK